MLEPNSKMRLTNLYKTEAISMSTKPEVMLKQFLLVALNAKTLEEVQEAIKLLCSKEDIARAEEIIAEAKKFH